MQDCHVMMTIMRIEQQIDRMGQEADKIVIGNLCIADTIDTVINIESSLISSNDVKIVSRMEAIKKLSELRIKEHQNNLIGANTKDTERLHKAIAKEQKKTVEKLRILEEKRKLGTSSFLQGVVLLELI